LVALLLCLPGCGSRYSVADIQAIREEAYQSGYDEGVSSGQTAGYALGKESGYAEGHDAGYAEGYDIGYTEGQSALAEGQTLADDQEDLEGDGQKTGTSGANQASAGGATARGYSDSTTVYVSKSGKKIHLKSDCSGMKNYTTMTLGEAQAKGYARCSRCFS
jgi:hypothetical protein